MSMDGLVVLVSGASKGIGRSIALRATAEGASVVINYMSDVKGANSLVAQIGADRALAVQADVSKTEEVDRLVEAAVSRFGKIDVLVPNAAFSPTSEIETITEEQFDRTFGVNVKGPCFLTQKTLPHMPPGSSVIFISSDMIDYNALPPEHLLYISTKGALNQMMRVIARSLAKQNIRVNAISPGATGTACFFKDNNGDTVKTLEEFSPFNRLGDPNEIAAAVSLLWRKESGWITGQVVKVNGGTT